MHLKVYILMTDSAWNFNEKVKAYSEVKTCHVIKKLHTCKWTCFQSVRNRQEGERSPGEMPSHV